LSGRQSSRPRWTGLNEAAFAIKSKYSWYAFGDTYAAIANAIRSNCVPVRGRKWSERALERLDGQFTPNGSVIIGLSRVVVRFNDYNSVEVDMNWLETYMQENLILLEFRLTEAYNSRTCRVDARLIAESAAHEYLNDLPQDAPIKTKAEFFEEINSPDHELYGRYGNRKLSERALDKVWSVAPKAWQRPGRRPANRG
jgi:hypothetical protein